MITVGTRVQAGAYRGVVSAVITEMEAVCAKTGVRTKVSLKAPVYEITLSLKVKYTPLKPNKPAPYIPAKYKGRWHTKVPATERGSVVEDASGEFRIKLYPNEFTIVP